MNIFTIFDMAREKRRQYLKLKNDANKKSANDAGYFQIKFDSFLKELVSEASEMGYSDIFVDHNIVHVVWEKDDETI